MTLKADFARTVERFAAWWVGEIIDRPPLSLMVKPRRPYQGPKPQHLPWPEGRFDAEYSVEAAIARLEQFDYVADSYPIYRPEIGPEISATLFGADLTTWPTPIIDSSEGWHEIIEMSPDFENPYWQAVERLTDYALNRCAGRYVVGLANLYGNYDLLAALRDPLGLCQDLIECPELLQQAGQHIARTFVAAFKRLYTKISAAGFGSAAWVPAYYEGPAGVIGCDFWGLVSSEMARTMILPDILIEMEPLMRCLFHLDGPPALRHLDLLLELSQLDAIQWVYGPGQGPAVRWIETYRRIRSHGKSLQVIAQDGADALHVLEAVGPEGIWISVEAPFASVEEAEDFVKEIDRFSLGKL